jgi:NitT/TauT family transport system substrate-binding protein
VIRRRIRSPYGDRSPARTADAGAGTVSGTGGETAGNRRSGRRRARRVAATLAAALAVTTFAAACGDDDGGDGGGEKIVLGYSAWPGWFPWKVAEEKGLFAENGVNVELKWFDNYTDSLTALATGAIDANSQTLNDTLISVSGGAKQVIVLTNDNSTGNDQIIAAKGIPDVAGLADKKVAVEKGTVDHFLLLLALEDAGLSGDDVEIVPLPTVQAANAFKSGQVDAVGVFAPSTTTALERPGSRVISDSRKFPGAIPDHLVVDPKLVASNREDVQGLVNTWFDTLAYIAAHRDEANEIMAKQADVSVEEYKTYDEGTTIFTLDDNVDAFTPGSTDANLDYQARKISTFLVETKLAKQEPSLDGLFDSSFIKKVEK